MKHLLKVLGLVLTSLVSSAKADPPAPQRPPDLPAPSLRLSGELVLVPMQLFGGRPQVEALVNGKKSYPFILDTAAARGRIPLQMVEELGLEPIGEAGVRSGVGEPVRVKLYKLDTLKLEGVEIRNLVVVGADFGPQKDDLPSALPVSAFADVLLTLDYPGQQVVVQRGELPPADGQTTFDYQGRLQSFPGTLGGVAVTFHPDSGSGGGISVSRELAAKLPLAAPPTPAGKARTINTEVEIFEAKLQGNAQWGKQVVEAPTLSILEGLREPLLGSDVLQHFSVALDQKNRRIRFVGKGAPPAAPAAPATPAKPGS
jgi:predicted aspartyl protease